MRILFAVLVFSGLGAARAADFQFDLRGQAFLESPSAPLVGSFDVMFTVDSQSGELLVIDVPPPNASLDLFFGDLTVTNYSTMVNGQLMHQNPLTTGVAQFASVPLGSGMGVGMPFHRFDWALDSFTEAQLRAALSTSDPLGYLFPLLSGDRATLEVGNTLGQVYDLQITSVSIKTVPVSAAEPATLALLAMACLALGFIHRRRIFRTAGAPCLLQCNARC